MIKRIFNSYHGLWRSIKKDYFKKIRHQFVALLIISTIIPILCVHLINFHLTSEVALKKNAAILDDNLVLSKINANNVINNYQKLLYSIFTDEIFIQNLEDFNNLDKNTTGYSYVCYKITNSITTHIRLHPEVRAVGIIDKNNKTHMIVENRLKNEHIKNYFNANSFNIFDNIGHQSTTSIDLIDKDNLNYEPDDPIFYIKQRIINHESMKYLGGIVIFINPMVLNEVINNKSSSTYKFSDKLIITENNSILCSRDNITGVNISELPKYENFNFINNTERTEYKNQNSLVSVVELSNYNLRLVNVVDNKILISDILNLWFYSFILIVSIMILALISAILSSNNVIKSVERMSNMMNILSEDNLNVSVEAKSNNEIRTIETSFNHMVKRINRLLEENKKQYEHISEITREFYLAELRSLELQINPHFLFNTIDTINWMAIREGCHDVSAQLGNLAQILRHTVYGMNTMVPLEKEIEWLKCYLDLQRHRFRKFNYDIFIKTNISNFFIHKLIIQPFIENSIIHGFEDISYTGHITVLVSMLRNQYLMIKIIDNGSGITAEKVNLINELFRTKESKDLGIGLKNIACRIDNYYDSRAKIHVHSNLSETCFTIYIPKDILGG